MIFTLLGGDLRSVYLCRRLMKDGYTVQSYGLELSDLPQFCRSDSLTAALEQTDCVVLLVNQSAVPVSASIYPSLLYRGEDGEVPVPLSGQYTELFTGERLRVRSVFGALVPAEGYCIYRKETNL